MIEKWGSIADAKHKPVIVTSNGQISKCILKDRMPWKKHIHNGAGIDLIPTLFEAVGLEPPIMAGATWQWA